MVSKQQFSVLEARVQQLETQGPASHQITFLKASLARLDPANKSLCLTGFTEQNVSARNKIIENFMKEKFADVHVVSIEHLFVGKGTERKLGNRSIVEFSGRSAREHVLKTYQEGTTKMKCGSSEIGMARAKTQLQLQRNTALRKAHDMIKESAPEAKINWKIEASHDRTISINNAVVFTQLFNDSHGTFSGAFAHLQF